MLSLKQINQLPEGLLKLETSCDIQLVFDQPTLLHFQGKQSSPLFVSILLHDNEDTGFLAVQQLLRKYQDKELPRSISIFYGNIAAAKKRLRKLDGQPDYNRVWPGTDHPDCEETRLMQQVVAEMNKRKPFASIDIHNNTGKNPHYGCINLLDTQFLRLASLFSRTVVFFETPKGVQSMAMAKMCPSVTIECGQPHQSHGVEHAVDFLDTVLHLDNIDSSHISHHDVDIYQTVAQVKVPRENTFSFSDPSADILFDLKLDKMNFSELYDGTVFGYVQNNSNARLDAWDDHGRDVSDEYFVCRDNKIVLVKPVMPAMLTLVEKIIRQDCLCYLMKRLKLSS